LRRTDGSFIITNTVEMDEPADEVIFVVRLRSLRA